MKNALSISSEIRNDIILVYPVCNKDADIACKNLEWMRELDSHIPHRAVLMFDKSFDASMATNLFLGMKEIFDFAEFHVYPIPPHETWPEAPNFAFQSAATYMFQKHKSPWLWLEPDATPLQPGWLSSLSDCYAACGKEVFGPVVDGRGHCNGVAVYPCNFAEISPLAMGATDKAWDYVCFPDVRDKMADARRIIQHAWGVVGWRLHPYLGKAPSFRSQEYLSWLNPNALIFHRCKDGSLIDRLRERKRVWTSKYSS